MWNLLDSTRQGRSHVKQGTPCQDKTYCQSYDDVYVITLADGAGSARLSHYGAKCVTKCIADELGWNFESYWDETTGKKRKYYCITKKGKNCLKEKKEEWSTFSSGINQVIGGVLFGY